MNRRCKAPASITSINALPDDQGWLYYSDHGCLVPILPTYPCPDCGAAPGHLHRGRGCPEEQCPACGLWWDGCYCESVPVGLPRVPWRGNYPGVVECREFGFIRKGTDPSGSEGVEDLNRLVLAVHDGGIQWDRNWRRFKANPGAGDFD